MPGKEEASAARMLDTEQAAGGSTCSTSGQDSPASWLLIKQQLRPSLSDAAMQRAAAGSHAHSEVAETAAVTSLAADAAVHVACRTIGDSNKQHQRFEHIVAAAAKDGQQRPQHLEQQLQQQESRRWCGDTAWTGLLAKAGRWPDMLLWQVILPSSAPALLWDVVMLLLILYLALLLPYAVAFDIDYTDLTNPWTQLDLAASVLFLFDVWMSFRTAFVDDNGHLVKQRRTIAVRYVRGWFVFDVLSSIPYEQLITISAYGIPAFATLVKMVRAVRIMKLFRLIKLLRMARVVKLPQVVERMEWVLGRPTIQLATMCGAVLLLLHWVACAWCYVAMWGDGGDNWVVAAGLANADDANKYVTALYWSISTAATIGYGDIVAHNLREKVLAVVVMLLGASVFGYFMGAMSVMVSATNNNRARMTAKRRAVDDFLRHRKVPRALAEKVRSYYAYVVEREVQADEADIIAGLSASLRTQVVFCLYQEALEKLPFFRGQSPQFITSIVTCLKLEYVAQGDIVVRQGDVGQELYFVAAGTLEVRVYEDEGGVPLRTATYKRSLTRAALRKQQSAAASATRHRLRPRRGAPQADTASSCGEGSDGEGDAGGGGSAMQQQRRLQRRGDEPPPHDSHRGASEWTYVDELSQRPYRCLGQLHAGEYFGERSCLLGQQHTATVVARTYVELYSLSRADLDGVLQQYPELAEDFDAMVHKAAASGAPTSAEQRSPSLAAISSPLVRWSMVRAACQQQSFCGGSRDVQEQLQQQQQHQRCCSHGAGSCSPRRADEPCCAAGRQQLGPAAQPPSPVAAAGTSQDGLRQQQQQRQQQHASCFAAAELEAACSGRGCRDRPHLDDQVRELPVLSAERSAASLTTTRSLHHHHHGGHHQQQQQQPSPGSKVDLSRSSAPLLSGRSSSSGGGGGRPQGLARVSPTAAFPPGLEATWRPPISWGAGRGSGLFRSNSGQQYLFPAFQDRNGALRPQGSGGADAVGGEEVRQASRHNMLRLSGSLKCPDSS